MRIVDLRTGYQHNPLGIVCGKPCFSWRLESRRPETMQRSYRIEVASSPELLLAGRADKWDSSFIDGSACSGIEYAGIPLVGTERCHWRVSCRDERGRTWCSREEAWFECALTPEQWEADWIGCPAGCEGGALVFRRAFSVHRPVVRARIYLAGLGLHELHLNGRKLGDRLLEPAWTDYSRRILYSCFDATSGVRPGENVIAVLVGNGWFGTPRLLAQLMLWYENGDVEVISTGSDRASWSDDWMVGASAITRNSLYHGETFDARLEQPGWDAPGFIPDPGKWWLIRATRVEAPGGELIPMELEPIRCVGTLSPVSVREAAPGKFIYDFGVNLAGWCALRVRGGGAGQAVTMRFSELLRDDGLVDQSNLRTARATDTYICRGGCREEYWEPRFTCHGFRYVQLEGVCRSDAVTLTAKILRSDVEDAGSFFCSDELLNRIYQNARRTEAGNLHSIPTDCPQRDERMGWLNDLTVRAEPALCHFNLSSFYAKFIDDIADTRDSSGAIADTAPFRWGGRPADPVSVSFVLLPWLLYVHYGDMRTMRRHYSALCGWFARLDSMTVQDILSYSVYGDWAPPATEFAPGAPPYSVRTPGALMSTGFLLYHARILGKIADALGMRGDACFFRRRESEIAVAFHRRFLRKDKSGYGGGNQASNAFALWLGIVPEPYRKCVFNALVDDLKAHDMHVTTGNLCTRYLFEVLSREGRSDLAVEILSRRDYPSYGYMIDHGATTIWERWEKDGNGMNSCNHPMYGSVCWWFFRYLAGISLDERAPGAGRVMIEPCVPPQLTRVAATLRTVRGPVAVSWRRRNRVLTLQVEIPPGAGGLIRFPAPGKTRPEPLTVGPGRHRWCLEFPG